MSGEQGAAASAAMILIYAGLYFIFVVAPLWNIFQKAEAPGWASIVPVWNLILLIQIVGRPTWWLILLFVPGVNAIISILLNIDLAKSFGKGTGFGIGLTLLSPIFLLMLGFGDADYVGPAAAA
ncbi:MAG: DUF5684 domain-containing protein [Chloroflexota bacterium]